MEGTLSPWHIAVVLVLALVLFGPKRLPELGSSLGKAIAGFKQGLQESQDEVGSAIEETPPSVPAAPLESSVSAQAAEAVETSE